MKRIFDTILGIITLVVLALPMLLIALLIKLSSRGPVVYWSDRVGINNKLFKMPKYRTMKTDTPALPTHLLTNPDHYYSTTGKILRKLSLDELPQIFSVLKGDMSFVGPRPALFNQEDLIELRTRKDIHKIVPGITGWAQINGRDELPIPVKVDMDEYYLKHRSFFFDLRILFLTLFNVIHSHGVQH